VAAVVRRVQRFRLRHLAQTRLWLVPLICVVAGIGLAVGLLSVDRSSGYHIVGTSVSGSAASAQTILTVASTALVTLTSVVLSLTLVAVQLATAQFSPRIVRAILDDRRSQLAVGLFIGTFAYSSPFQDPTTSVQSINAIHDILRGLARREFPSGRHHDAHRNVRLVVRVMTWEGYVRLAFDELRLAGAGSPQVARRLRAALEDLSAVALPERRPPLDRQLTLLDAAVRRAYADEADVEAALVPDMQGIGSGPDVMSAPPRSASPPARDIRRRLADPAGARFR
jgi:uncharacterized membrane protein